MSCVLLFYTFSLEQPDEMQSSRYFVTLKTNA